MRSARGGGLIALALAALLFVPSTSWSHGSRSATASLSGTIKIFNGAVEISILNNGPDSTNWVWIRLVPSVHHTGATMDGGGCGPGGDSNTVRCGIASPGFTVGSTHVIHISTDAPYPTNGGAQLFTSDLFSGPPVPAGTATGPAPATTPPAPKPCTCVSLTPRIVGSSLKIASGDLSHLDLRFTVHWTMGCTKGAGGCHAWLRPHAPSQRPNPKAGDRGYETHWVPGDAIHDQFVRIDCTGPCGKVSEGGKALTLKAKRGLDADDRAHESIPIVIDRYCGSRKLAQARLSVAFGANGRLDLAKSKLR
jgi:hypothetical protein